MERMDDAQQNVFVLPLSAASPALLEEQTAALLASLKALRSDGLVDLELELRARPALRGARRVIICRTPTEAIAMLERQEGVARFIHTNKKVPAAEPPIAFMFPGQGAQYPRMAKGLYDREPVIRSVFDPCARIAKNISGIDLKEIVFPKKADDQTAERLRQTEVTQPALFAVECALARLWEAKGIRPDAMIGHSIGEYAAAHLAGVFSLEGAMELVCHRAHLMQQAPPGAMASLMATAAQVEELLRGTSANLASLNSPNACVVSGSFEGMEQVRSKAEERGIPYQQLRTSHAFHSASMEAAQKTLGPLATKQAPQPPRVPFMSNVSGDWFTDSDAANPAYWGAHLRNPVRFSDGMARLEKNAAYLYIEVGPGNGLSTLARQHMARPSLSRAIATLRHPKESHPDPLVFQAALARCWLAGREIDWNAR